MRRSSRTSPRQRAQVPAFLLCLTIVGACMGRSASDATSDAVGGTGGSTISYGSAGSSCDYPFDPPPPPFTAFTSGTMSAPQCGTQPWEPLPCGACAGEQVCATGHTRWCCGVAPPSSALWSPLDEWLCSCQDGAWTCWVMWAAAATCLCQDAGDG